MTLPKLEAAKPDTRWEVLWDQPVENVTIGLDDRSEPMLYATRKWTNDIYEFGGWPMEWNKIGKFKKQLAATRGAQLFHLRYTGLLERYTGTPDSWLSLVAPEPFDRIIAGGKELYAIGVSDKIYQKREGTTFEKLILSLQILVQPDKYAGYEAAFWEELPNQANISPTLATADASGRLYAMGSQKTVMQFDPVTQKWTSYGQPRVAVTALIAGGSQVYVQSSTKLYAQDLPDTPTDPSQVAWSFKGDFIDKVFLDDNNVPYAIDSGSKKVRYYDASLGQWVNLSSAVDQLFAGARSRVYATTPADFYTPGLLRFRHTLERQTRFNPIVQRNSQAPVGLQGNHLNLSAVVVEIDGSMAFNTTSTPNGWAPNWSVVSPQGSNIKAHSTTAPVLLNAPAVHPVSKIRFFNSWLFLFIRGEDNNLYATRRTTSPGNQWHSWQKLDGIPSIEGDLSIARLVTTKHQSTQFDFIDVHVVYQSANQLAVHQHYRIVDDKSPWVLQSSHTWPQAKSVQVAIDDLGQAWAVVQKDKGVFNFYRRPAKGSFPWKLMAKHTVSGVVVDHSQAVAMGDQFHILLTRQHNNQEEIIQLECINDKVTQRLVTSQPQSNDGIHQTSLAVYRNKLVALYTDPKGLIHWTRQDNADPNKPWLGHQVLDGGVLTSIRPTLVTMPWGKLGFFQSSEGSSDLKNDLYFGGDHFGNDLFTVVMNPETQTAEVMNVSRTIFQHEVDSEFAIFSFTGSDADYFDRTEEHQLVTDISNDGRPYLTELGFGRWLLPQFIHADFADFHQKRCAELQQQSSPGQWYPEACSRARNPIVIKTTKTTLNPRTDRVRLFAPRGIQSTGFMHELEHYRGGWMGFNMPVMGLIPKTWPYSKMSLPEIKDAFDFLGKGLHPACLKPTTPKCPDRIPGFVGVAKPEEGTNIAAFTSSRDHSYIYTLTSYLAEGDRLRRWVQEDIEQYNNPFLEAKYEWIRKNFFHGVQFGPGFEPTPETRND